MPTAENYAVVFPGQGAQFVGMGKDLYERSSIARTLMDRAQEILSELPLLKTMFEGPESRLQETIFTQPAIYLHSLADFYTRNLQPVAVAGHSLGEFTALVVAGVFSFEDGLKLVYARARAMQKACEVQSSSMCAVIGLDNEVISRICQEIQQETGEVLVPANLNAPDQIVVSGTQTAIQLAIDRFQEAGARKVVPLKVHGAFHSPLMEPARKELAEVIQKIPFQDARIPVYQNVSAQPETHAEVIRQNLIQQMTSPVRWTETIRRMLQDGIEEFIEVGPGKVLTGLIRRIRKSLSS